MRSHSPGQEEIEKLKAMKDDGESGQESADSGGKGDSDSESCSSFGCAESDSEAGAKKKKKKTATQKKPAAKDEEKTPALPDAAKSAPSGANEGNSGEKSDNRRKTNRAQRVKQERADKLKTAAVKAHSSLKEVSADMVWRSVIRTGEVDRRLQKCGQTERDLLGVSAEFFENDEVVQKLLCPQAGMAIYAEYMTGLKDLCKGLRAVSPEDALQDVISTGPICQNFIKCFFALMDKRDQSTLQDMLLTLGKRLIDASATWFPTWFQKMLH